ncbi:hypothetical protein MC7420_2621 [Coleofasciculus chthonoplastes PCC 7420]|uniref:Uncharacterized protein n=1 Tax=Coleofasciculus chthonoplastes PCC 7420 TaxID=118168 RepID=B4VYA6_9CYAN|nr:hypothetical protein MC7420_2621 [Coleofasciculus chthonoplastes PCC 7420]
MPASPLPSFIIDISTPAIISFLAVRVTLPPFLASLLGTLSVEASIRPLISIIPCGLLKSILPPFR